tara:strand:- start:6104 stop:7120 length:1017 start_codon:yes stop_codon:yes gene_type:complete
MMARVTLADVAAVVGVSAKTVSNVVNGTGWVSDDMRARILAAIRELDYRPNLAARQLRGGSSGLLALAVPDLREPYFAEFAAQFVATAQERRQTVLIAQTGGDRAAEMAFAEAEGMPALDGLVLSPLSITKADLEERRSRTPMVVVGEHGRAVVPAGITHVGIDNVAAAHAATDYLISRGRTRIAAVGVQHEGSTATSRQRFVGYRQALAGAGIPLLEPLLCPVGPFNRAEGSRAVDALIERGAAFDALMCFNDTLALGALYSLGAHGVAVPRDVDVIGFDDIEEGRFSIPPFATVDSGVEAASRMILDLLAAPAELPGGHHEVPFRLMRCEGERIRA